MRDRWVELARRWIPPGLRYWIQKQVSLTDLKLRHRAATNPYAGVTAGDDNRSGSPVRFGIAVNAAQYHQNYVAACTEMGVPFRVLDLYRSDWLEQVRHSGCGALLLWPDSFLSVWGRMLKDRAEVLGRDLGIPLFPTLGELWMYEDKHRTAYWLEARGIPHPRTRVFYALDDALRFASDCPLPVVYKASFGAGASGVRIFRRRAPLLRFIKGAFARGILPSGFDRRDRQWGCALLQEYLPEVKEWRMVRIGDSFFGHPKGRLGEFHSGSGVVLWDRPSPAHFDLLEKITEEGGFRSMDVDLFETPDGRLLVNELQTVFGAGYSVDQSRVDGKAGRFVRAPGTGEWVFEEGDWARNACANERVRYLLTTGRDRLLPREDRP